MEGWIQKIKVQQKAAFFSAVVVGVISFLYTMTHHFLTYDSMWNLVSDQDMISSGRPFLTYACGISSWYDLPGLNGILAILYLALTAVFLVEIFDVQNTLTAILIGGLAVSFPSVTSTFCYTYTVDGYMLAILLTTIAFWMTNRYKYGFVGGLFLAGFSIGIYQAYYAYLIALCIFFLLKYLLEEDEIKKVFARIWRYLVVGIGGYLFYVVALNVMLAVKSAAVSGYQGTDKVLQNPFGNLLSGLGAALTDARNFAQWGHVFTITTAMKCAYVVLLLCGIVGYVFCFVKQKRHRRISYILLAIALFAVLPFGLEVIVILAPDVYAHLLTRYAWVCPFLFILLLKDRKEIGLVKRFQTPFSYAVVISTIVMIFQFVVVANIVSFQMEERYEKTYGLCLRIVNRLEHTEDYRTGMPVAILGGVVDSEYYPETSATTEVLVGFFGPNGEYSVNSTSSIREFCIHYLNFFMVMTDAKTEAEIVESREFAEMEKFPDAGSIRLINGVWVIKLNG